MDAITALGVDSRRTGQIERGLSLEPSNRNISSIKAAFNRAVEGELLGTIPIGKVKKRLKESGEINQQAVRGPPVGGSHH